MTSAIRRLGGFVALALLAACGTNVGDRGSQAGDLSVGHQALTELTDANAIDDRAADVQPAQ